MMERPCHCEGPPEGERLMWCERHQCHKTAHLVMLCQTREDYWRAWEEGRGPGQNSASPEREPSRQAQSTPPPGDAFPSVPAMAWNLAKSLAAFVADGLKTVDPEQYQRRLETCDGCDRRRGNRCAACGCMLSLKARGRAFRCPLDKWPSLDPSDQ